MSIINFMMSREKVNPSTNSRFINDDLLMEILIRMPTKSIYKFRFVSKRWNNLITSTYFLQTHQTRIQDQLPMPLGFMISLGMDQQPGAIYINQTPTSPAAQFHDLLNQRLTRFDQKVYHFHSFTNGLATWFHDALILLLHHEKFHAFHSFSNGLALAEITVRHNYRVIDLQTQVYVEPPCPPHALDSTTQLLFWEKISTCAALVYEEVESQHAMEPRYKIVVAPMDHDRPVDNLPVLIYSSHTGDWTKSTMRSSHGIFSINDIKPPVVLNQFLHWYCRPWGIAIMDTKRIVNKSKMIDVQLIPLPRISIDDPYFNYGFTRTSCDDLWFGAIDNGNIYLWRLPREKHSYNYTNQIESEEWFLMDSIPVATLTLTCPGLTLNHGNDDSTFFKIEALIPWKGDIIVLLRFVGYDREITFYYHRTSKHLDFIGTYEIRADDSNNWIDNLCLGWSPVMKPLTLCSYGPLKHKPSSIWRCRNCNCEECSALMDDKVENITSMVEDIFDVFVRIPGFTQFFKFYSRNRSHCTGSKMHTICARCPIWDSLVSHFPDLLVLFYFLVFIINFGLA